MAGRQRYTPRQVIAAIEAHKGMLTLAAQHLGCSDETMYNYAKRHKSVAAAIKRQRERMLDVCELKLYAAIHQGQSWAIQYFLRTIGKSRGYVERQELTGAEGDALTPATLIILPAKDPRPEDLPRNGDQAAPAPEPIETPSPPPARPNGVSTPAREPRRRWSPC